MSALFFTEYKARIIIVTVRTAVASTGLTAKI